jgi:hypothetical protein
VARWGGEVGGGARGPVVRWGGEVSGGAHGGGVPRAAEPAVKTESFGELGMAASRLAGRPILPCLRTMPARAL